MNKQKFCAAVFCIDSSGNYDVPQRNIKRGVALMENKTTNPQTISVTRDQLTKAAKSICPEQAHLVPSIISATDLWNMAMKKAFIFNMQSEDVEILRAGLKKVFEQGLIE